MTNKELASKIFKAVKTDLAKRRKTNKEHNYPIGSWSRSSQMVDFEVWDNDKWENGKRYTESYTIKLNRNNDMGKVKTRTDISEVFTELGNLLGELKKTKGWGGLCVVTDTIEFNNGVSYWNTYKVKYISKVCLADAPCSEYKSLMNYINKYGRGKYGSSMNLGNYELFSAAMGGKRGRLWDEYGERIFLDNRPKRCARILEELRKYRGTKDTMLCERGNENYIDEIDRKYSEYHEVECEGEKRYYLNITIKTPQGKVKYEQKIY